MNAHSIAPGLLLLAFTGIASVSLAGAQPTPSSTDIAAIQAIVTAEQTAWNHGDAKAFGEHYAEDGSFTNIVGTTLYGRQGFIAQHERIFSTIYKGSTASFTIARTRFVRPDVAIVDVDAKLTGYTRLPPHIQPASDGSLLTKLQLVLTKDNGQWWIAAFHNVPVAPIPPTP